MRKILVVEDNKDLNLFLVKRLQASGFAVDTVEHGYAVLSYLKTGAVPDAVVLDLMLPGRSGLELLDTLTAQWSDTRIFIFSAHAEHEEKRMLKRYNLAGYFCKSEGMDKLIEAIKAAFAEEGGESEA